MKAIFFLQFTLIAKVMQLLAHFDWCSSKELLRVFCLYMNVKVIKIKDMNDVIRIHIIVLICLFFNFTSDGAFKVAKFYQKVFKTPDEKEYIHKYMLFID